MLQHPVSLPKSNDNLIYIFFPRYAMKIAPGQVFLFLGLARMSTRKILRRYMTLSEADTLMKEYVVYFICFMSVYIYYRGERIVFCWPNTNIIWFPKNGQIRIRILFGFPKMTEYEYEYYSVSQKWPNTKTNIIRFL